MAEKRDYYEVLGVNRDASPDEVKKAYRRMARTLHPDVNRDDPHAEERFKELGEAYDVLSDAQKRAGYDRYGHAAVNGMGAAGGQDFAGYGFGDLFETFFGGTAQMSRPDPRGADMRYDLEITLEEAAFGTEKVIHVPHQGVCETCQGRGTAEGHPVPCPACAGTGQRRQSTTNFFGLHMTSVTPCDRCGATGEIIPHPCKVCGGQGRKSVVDELQATIPPGANTGSRLRFRAKGHAGLRGAQAGDLLVVIHVRPHDIFERRGDDLFAQVRLPFATAALGGRLTVPTLQGEEVIDVPPGTQHGHLFRLRGFGMPEWQGPRHGDLYIAVALDVPTDLTPRQRELLHEFAVERGDDVERKPKGLFQKMKETVEDVMEDYRDKSREAFGG
jgi:molecular chaperone DnaJ